jgi:Na+/melibiose symporter-like transporter
VNKTSSLTADRSRELVAALLALAWLGLFLHNSIELPSLNVLSPENSLPALVAVLLFAGWWLLPTRRLAAALLLVWGLLHLVGGAIVTVIPFSFLPFVPDQDFIHYFAHFLYALAQLPLIGVMIQQMRRLPKAGA